MSPTDIGETTSKHGEGMADSDRLYEISDAERKQLAVLAIEAKAKAYCPYSNFRVGASLLLSSGTYHTGSNVEVASTPVGTCAERCAIAPVIASYKRPAMPRIRAMAVSTDIWPPASCCGMCREPTFSVYFLGTDKGITGQFIREFCEPEMKIFMYGRKQGRVFGDSEEEAEEEYVAMTIGELLPMSFGSNDMDKRSVK